jgi:spore germination protein YaaH
VLHPIVFIPGADGALGGTPPAVPPASYTIVPGVVAPDPAVVEGILRSDQLRNSHASAIADKVESGNYAGISIDYRNVSPTLREQFTSFIETLSELLEERGRTLTLTLPMPARTEGEFDSGAYDWEKLGAAADWIEMAGELDQELYFQNTEAALEYVLDRVDKSKLLLTVTSMSVERGGDGLRAMPLESALALASTASVKTEAEIVAGGSVELVAQNLAQSEGASGMLWDEAARAVTFNYPGRGGKRTVWLANQFSAAFRVELAQRYGLAGVAVDNVALEDGAADVWAPIRELSDTGSIVLSKPNTDRFAPQWSAAAGTLSATSGDSVIWTAPAEPGTYEVTLTVSDGVVRVAQTFSLEVVPAAAEEPVESE